MTIKPLWEQDFYDAHIFPLVLWMEDDVDNGTVIYTTLTEHITAADFSCEKSDDITS